MTPHFVTRDWQQPREKQRGARPSAEQMPDFCTEKLGPLFRAQNETSCRQTSCEALAHGRTRQNSKNLERHALLSRASPNSDTKCRGHLGVATTQVSAQSSIPVPRIPSPDSHLPSHRCSKPAADFCESMTKSRQKPRAPRVSHLAHLWHDAPENSRCTPFHLPPAPCLPLSVSPCPFPLARTRRPPAESSQILPRKSGENLYGHVRGADYNKGIVFGLTRLERTRG